MSIQPVIAPFGHLIVESVADDDFTRAPLKSEIVAELQSAFDKSAAAGLARLASGGGTVNLSADFV